MNNKLLLNGDNWKVSGWVKHQWRLRNSMELNKSHHAPVPAVQARVPGSVQLDLMRAGVLSDPNFGLNSLDGEWVNNREWIYTTEFSLSHGHKAQKYILCFDGLDYSGEIFLNNTRVSDFSGMFIPVEIDITGLIDREGTNHLMVVFYQAPEVDGQYGYSDRIRILKSRFNYTWDWCPRIIPVGIWADVYIKMYNFVSIQDFSPRAVSEPGSQNGKIIFAVDLKAEVEGEYTFTYKVRHKGKDVCSLKENQILKASKQSAVKEIRLDNISLWWPAGHGDQNLYEVALEISLDGKLCDTAQKRIGLRSAEFYRNEGAPADSLPYTLQVNGKRIFIRGVNWVPISPFYGAVTKEQYANCLQRFLDMNCNLLRVWGGAILESQLFYDLCDEMGLMVWQEFPQSSSGINNAPPDDPMFLNELKEVAAIFLNKRKHHACHVVWCGGNELLWDTWKPVDENHSNIRMLKQLVEEKDAGKYFLPASPSGPRFDGNEKDFGKNLHHDIHGPWTYEGNPQHYRYFNMDDSLVRTEVGCPGISRIETLEKYKKSFDLWPPDETNLYWLHRGAWWIQLKELTELFGEWKDTGEEIGQYVKASRYIQAEALRYAAEAARRREPLCSGFILWMGNEPFPNNANTSVIEYDGTPKPAYYWVGNAFSKTHVSVKYPRVSFLSGETFTGVLYLHNESDSAEKFTVKAYLTDLRGNTIADRAFEITGTRPVLELGTLEWKVCSCEGNIFFLRVQAEGEAGVLNENTYVFTVDTKHPFEPLRGLPPCEISLDKAKGDRPGYWTVRNNSPVTAVGVFIYGRDPEDFLKVSANYLTLFPGETKEIYMESKGRPLEDIDTICVDTIP